ncbi:cap protein [Human smacovirus 1]|nr:cap protein [Human smacovirus 1]
MMQKFRWFVDLSTTPERVSVLKITCGGTRCLRRLLPFFSAYKYFKLGKTSVKFVPSSTLPVDPTGLSYEAGENTVDPRDMFNPGLVRITNGEDLADVVLNNISTAEDQNNVYYAMMLDSRWYKFRLQDGFRRDAVPLYWRIGQLHQDNFPGSVNNYLTVNSDVTKPPTVSHEIGYYAYSSPGSASPDRQNQILLGSSPHGTFQFGHHDKIGWLPTDMFTNNYVNTSGTSTMSPRTPPEVDLLTVVLPAAYKTRFYYRLYITEEVYFKEPVSIFAGQLSDGQYVSTTMDRFTYPTLCGKFPGNLNGVPSGTFLPVELDNSGGDTP